MDARPQLQQRVNIRIFVNCVKTKDSVIEP